MAAVPFPLTFRIGARTLASVRRRMVRVALTLDDAVGAVPPALPRLDDDAHGYAVTSLPEAQLDAVRAAAGGGMITFVRQRYTRYFADLTIGHDAYLAKMSGNTRSVLKRKVKRLEQVSGGTLDIRRFSTPDEMTIFHVAAREISAETYQEKLLDAGLPIDQPFMTGMYAMAAAGNVRAWLLYIAGAPVAYLYCPIHAGTVLYEYVGHHPDHGDLSPGAVLHSVAMRDLFEQGGLKRFDFTEGEGQHKRQLATAGVACVDVLLLRRTLANRMVVASLRMFDEAVAGAKRIVERRGLGGMAKTLRRA